MMPSPDITNPVNDISIHQAAVIAGIGILIMVIIGPFAQFYAYESLITTGKPAETAENIINNKTLFTTGIFGVLIVLICDILVAWALFVLLKPVNRSISLLTAWFRLAYAVLAMAALINLVMVLRFADPPDYLAALGSEELSVQLYLSLVAFEKGWGIALIIFSIHLWLLGYLVFRSDYIPGILGIFLIIGGLGWLIDSLRPYFFPGIKLEFWMITVWGEVFFMLWLLIRGWKIRVAF